MADPKPKADTELDRALASFRATVEANSSKHQPPAAPKPAKVVQLPLWPEPVRGAPNSFLRSALFAAIQGKTRRRLKKQFLGALEGVTRRFVQNSTLTRRAHGDCLQDGWTGFEKRF